MKKLLTALSIMALAAITHAEVNVVNQVSIAGAATDTTISGNLAGVSGTLEVRDTGQAIAGSVVINSTDALTDFSVINEVKAAAAGGNAIAGSVLITQ